MHLPGEMSPRDGMGARLGGVPGAEVWVWGSGRGERVERCRACSRSQRMSLFKDYD